MNEEAQILLEEFQEQLKSLADEEKISYGDDGVYGMAIMLDSILNDDLTTEQAVNEYIANSNLKIETEVV